MLGGAIGPWELVVIMLAVLILFGPKRLPELARGLGKAMQEFRKAAEEVRREIDISDQDDELQG
ncbi:MAG: twin-arginine translocase TatA/TatE family subunit [bacterium]|nr:twin-arginine translocase TatA/TatE family subunit [candidate division KSB1 bacterium]MDH7561058.1 twin-arginine translocase TatA/TatE family subunit [bacterium]